MAEIFLVRKGSMLAPSQESDLDSLKKLTVGRVYKAEIKAFRNYEFHKKLFSLLNLAFEYWEPGTMIAEVERSTVERLKGYFVKHGISEDATSALCEGFLKELESQRIQYDAGKDFDNFRHWVTVKAGYYNLVSTPAGPRKVAKSISYASMDELEFGNYYKQILNVCWELCLNKIFTNQDELAGQLLSYD